MPGLETDCNVPGAPEVSPGAHPGGAGASPVGGFPGSFLGFLRMQGDGQELGCSPESPAPRRRLRAAPRAGSGTTCAAVVHQASCFRSPGAQTVRPWPPLWATCASWQSKVSGRWDPPTSMSSCSSMVTLGMNGKQEARDTIRREPWEMNGCQRARDGMRRDLVIWLSASL